MTTKTPKSQPQDEVLAPYRRVAKKTPPSESGGEERLAAYRRVAQDAAAEVPAPVSDSAPRMISKKSS